MAWATQVEGPYTLYNTHADPNLEDGMPGRGVLDMIDKKERLRFKMGKVAVGGTVASPDVHIDHKNKQFLMYVHMSSTKSTGYDSGYFNTGGQKTMVATSATGLNFNQSAATGSGGVMGGEEGHGLRPAYLGNAYFKVFEVKNGNNAGLYAFSNYGPVWKAPKAEVPWDMSGIEIGRKVPDTWTEGPKLESPVYKDLRDHFIHDLLQAAAGKDPAEVTLAPGARIRTRTGGMKHSKSGWKESDGGSPRHFAVLMQKDGKTLEVWYTARGDSPERIFRTTIDTSQNTWKTWNARVTNRKTVHDEMLRPVHAWEGADLKAKAGANGVAKEMANALRDPDLFRDEDGKVYLLYAGGGESGIGIARVEGF